MLIEGLSEDESKMVLDKYKKRYAAVLKSNPDFIKKYPNPDAVIYGMAIKEVKKLREKLSKSADVGDYKKDFRKSDAKQFQGKSKKKIDQMATAAFLSQQDKLKEGDLDVGHQDDEPRMLKKDIYNMGKYAMEIYKKLDRYDDMEGEVDFPHWWQSKLTKAKSMLQSAYDYLDGEERISQVDAIMEEDKLPVNKIEDKVKAILKKEGGAVGLKPLVNAAKELGASKKDLLDILKKMKSIKTHKDGDIIDTAGLNEGHGLDKGDLDYLKDLASRTDNTKLEKILKGLIKSNILVDKTKDLSKGKKVDEASGMDIAKKNMDMYKDKNRLEELVKAALMGPISEKMDPVGQEDDDINNDGKVDKTDKYLKNKRDAISKNIKEDNIDEISKRDEIKRELAKGNKDTINDSMGYLMDLIADFIKDNPNVSPEQVSSQFKKLLEPDEIRGYLKTAGMEVKEANTNESFKSLSKDIDKQKGKTKKDGDNIAGYIANIKREGGGKGPTAKQKKRMAETILKELRG